uniref:Uncharacterized protein n=1 Tax=Colobus angolensis palliatus TaxID=336983 RepID=A0A2K5ISI7_COLAP
MVTGGEQGLSQGEGDVTHLHQPMSREPYKQPRGHGSSTHAGAHVLQVGGVHGGAQCHRPCLSLFQVVLHLHDAELQVHTPALLTPALLAGQDLLVWRENYAGLREQHLNPGQGALLGGGRIYIARHPRRTTGLAPTLRAGRGLCAGAAWRPALVSILQSLGGSCGGELWLH